MEGGAGRGFWQRGEQRKLEAKKNTVEFSDYLRGNSLVLMGSKRGATRRQLPCVGQDFVHP